MDQRFPPSQRLHTNGDYARTFQRQQKAAGRHVVVLVNARSRRAGPHGRIGIMIPNKAVKTAVRRHELKRWVRELYRLQLKGTLAGFDTVVLFRANPPDDHAALDAEILALVPRALNSKPGPPRGGRNAVSSAPPARRS